MPRLSDILEKIIKKDQQLEYYLSNRLINLSQYAKFIRPLVMTRMGKNVESSAITMALSRVQKKIVEKNKIENFKIGQINLHSDLCTLSFDKTPSIHKKIQSLFNLAIDKKTYFTISESTKEITIISKKEFIQSQKIPTPKFKHLNLSAIAIQFDPKYLSTPGLVTTIMQKLSLQNINFIEIASTCTEFTCYIDHSDLRLAFDTLHDCFLNND